MLSSHEKQLPDRGPWLGEEHATQDNGWDKPPVRHGLHGGQRVRQSQAEVQGIKRQRVHAFLALP